MTQKFNNKKLFMQVNFNAGLILRRFFNLG